MLVLSRKPGESIHIGSDIVITICENSGGRVRVGISCPRDVPIRRSELPVLDLLKAARVAAEPTATSPDIDIGYSGAHSMATTFLS